MRNNELNQNTGNTKVEGEMVNEAEIEKVAPPLPTTLPPALANNVTYEIVSNIEKQNDVAPPLPTTLPLALANNVTYEIVSNIEKQNEVTPPLPTTLPPNLANNVTYEIISNIDKQNEEIRNKIENYIMRNELDQNVNKENTKVEGEMINGLGIEEVAPPLPTTPPPALASNITYEIISNIEKQNEVVSPLPTTPPPALANNVTYEIVSNIEKQNEEIKKNIENYLMCNNELNQNVNKENTKVEGEMVNGTEIEEVAPPLPTTLPPALASNVTYEPLPNTLPPIQQEFDSIMYLNQVIDRISQLKIIKGKYFKEIKSLKLLFRKYEKANEKCQEASYRMLKEDLIVGKMSNLLNEIEKKCDIEIIEGNNINIVMQLLPNEINDFVQKLKIKCNLGKSIIEKLQELKSNIYSSNNININDIEEDVNWLSIKNNSVLNDLKRNEFEYNNVTNKILNYIKTYEVPSNKKILQNSEKQIQDLIYDIANLQNLNDYKLNQRNKIIEIFNVIKNKYSLELDSLKEADDRSQVMSYKLLKKDWKLPEIINEFLKKVKIKLGKDIKDGKINLNYMHNEIIRILPIELSDFLYALKTKSSLSMQILNKYQGLNTKFNNNICDKMEDEIINDLSLYNKNFLIFEDIKKSKMYYENVINNILKNIKNYVTVSNEKLQNSEGNIQLKLDLIKSIRKVAYPQNEKYISNQNLIRKTIKDNCVDELRSIRDIINNFYKLDEIFRASNNKIKKLKSEFIKKLVQFNHEKKFSNNEIIIIKESLSLENYKSGNKLTFSDIKRQKKESDDLCAETIAEFRNELKINNLFVDIDTLINFEDIDSDLKTKLLQVDELQHSLDNSNLKIRNHINTNKVSLEFTPKDLNNNLISENLVEGNIFCCKSEHNFQGNDIETSTKYIKVKNNKLSNTDIFQDNNAAQSEPTKWGKKCYYGIESTMQSGININRSEIVNKIKDKYSINYKHDNRYFSRTFPLQKDIKVTVPQNAFSLGLNEYQHSFKNFSKASDSKTCQFEFNSKFAENKPKTYQKIPTNIPIHTIKRRFSQRTSSLGSEISEISNKNIETHFSNSSISSGFCSIDSDMNEIGFESKLNKTYKFNPRFNYKRNDRLKKSLFHIPFRE